MISMLISPTSKDTMTAATKAEVEHLMGIDEDSYSDVADLIMRIVDWLLSWVGLENNETCVTILYAVVVLGIAMIVGYIAKWIILGSVRQIVKKWNSEVFNRLTNVDFFSKVCRMIPALVFLILIQFTLSSHDKLATLLTKVTLIYVVYVTGIAISALITAIWRHIDERENKRKLPLNGLAQLAKGIVWIIAAIIVICLIIDKSPGSFLAGLGAFSAVLLLIFKDSILGLAAGLQLSENDSLHVGDWIKVDGTDANGTVEEVTLVSVKVQNWDKTTTTLPPYSLISGSFTNYRSMQESNTRRVCRSYMIDADSVLPATPQMLENLKSVPFMDHFITTKLAQKAAGQVADVNNPAGLVNGTIDTNLGLFRAYMKMWLDANPHVSHVDDCFVSTLAQVAGGIPLQIYCFTSTSQWFPYEAIQDTIFEHLAAMLHVFQLYSYESPSSRDVVAAGYLSNQANKVDEMFGMPYPFFQNPNAPDGPRSTRVDSDPQQTSDTTPPQKS
ncbi:MAG: mechanosensitive ion channel [Bacteroides sp.]|nr:mechanosensitive ion channel [Bacteroides sp.]